MDAGVILSLGFFIMIEPCAHFPSSLLFFFPFHFFVQNFILPLFFYRPQLTRTLFSPIKDTDLPFLQHDYMDISAVPFGQRAKESRNGNV